MSACCDKDRGNARNSIDIAVRALETLRMDGEREGTSGTESEPQEQRESDCERDGGRSTG
jgi:hypothetical protein